MNENKQTGSGPAEEIRQNVKRHNIDPKLQPTHNFLGKHKLINKLIA